MFPFMSEYVYVSNKFDLTWETLMHNSKGGQTIRPGDQLQSSALFYAALHEVKKKKKI